MKLSRKQLRNLIMEALSEAAETIVPDDSGHAFAKHKFDPETERYFDFLDQHFIPDAPESRKAAAEPGLDINRLIGMAQTYQGRTDDGRMKFAIDQYRRQGGYDKKGANLASKVRKHDGDLSAMGKIGRY